MSLAALENEGFFETSLTEDFKSLKFIRFSGEYGEYTEEVSLSKEQILKLILDLQNLASQMTETAVE